jgi:hypothetical protein
MSHEPAADPELIDLTLKYQSSLPPEFFTDLVGVASDLAVAQWPTASLTRGTKEGVESAEAPKGWSTRLREAILEEIYLLVCTEDPKYGDLRDTGRALSKPGVTAIASAVSTVFVGVPIGLVTGAVAYLVLLVARVGANSLCRAYSTAPKPQG